MFPFPFASPLILVSASHRYWRINITANDGTTYSEVGEIAWLESYYGFGLGSGGTAIASSAFGGSVAANAYDGTATTIWVSSAPTLPQYLGYDFGAGNEKAIVGVVITGANAGFTNRSPKDFDVQYSDNGSSWTTAWSVTGSTSWAANEVRTFYTTGLSAPSYSGSPWPSATNWRIAFDSAEFGSGQAAIAEIQMRATPGGSDQCSGGTASASTVFGSGYEADKAFDNNASTMWSASVSGPGWVAYQFASSVNVAEVVLTARNDGLPNRTPSSVYVEFAASSSGPWRRAWADPSETGWTNGQSRTYTDPLYI